MRCARFAIAILAAVASLAAESHRTAAAEPSRDRETVISRVSVGLEGSGRFEGGSAPHARIALVLGDRPVGETTADSDGAWKLSVTRVLAVGEHRVRIVARTGEAGEPSISPTVRISIPTAFAAPATEPETAEGDLIRRAGELADRASEAFDELLPRLIDPPGSPDEADLRAQPSSRVKLAAFQASQPASIHGDAATGDGLLQWLASILADAEAWLEASARDYQSVIVRRLADPPPAALGAPKVQSPLASLPLDLTRAAEAERLREAEAKRAAEEARRQQQLAKAEAEARRASEAEGRRKAAEEARRQQELAKAEAETRRKVGEAQRFAEAEAKRKAVDEARRRQELARAEEEAARKTAEARRLAEAETKRQEADELRRQQELAKAEAEAQRIAAAELRRQPQSAEPPASQEQGARSMSVAAPAPLGTTKRTAPRKARRDKPQLVRYTGVTAGSGNWCDFFQYSYPMELLDPGHRLSASAGRR